MELLTSVQQTSDGGYMLGGHSFSAASADKSGASKGNSDYWVVKLSANGNKEWDKSYGGTDFEYFSAVEQTAKGGYILGGYSYSGVGADKSEPNGGTSNPEDRQPDMWIVKLAGNGTVEWEKSLVRRGEEQLDHLSQTSDGGYIAIGSGYMVKLSGSGVIQWSRENVVTIGSDQSGNIQTADAGFILGSRVTAGYKVTKLSSSGNIQLEKTYISTGTGTSTTAPNIKFMADGGYMLSGTSDYGMGGDKSKSSNGQKDYWIIKITADGTKVWDRTYGGNGNEAAGTVYETKDGGYMISGTSDSGISGDKTEITNGITDAWIVKITEDGMIQWQRTLGGTKYLQYGYDHGNSYLGPISQDDNGNYILAGYTTAKASEDKTSDEEGTWMVKLAPNGSSVWNKSFGHAGLKLTKDGGYLMYSTRSTPAGATKSENSRGGDDYWIAKYTAEATTKTLATSTPSVSFRYVPGTITPSQTITIASSAGPIPQLNIVKSEGAKWLTIQQGTNGSVSLTVNASGVAAGVYNAVVHFFAPDYSRVTLPVQLVVISEEATNTYVRINAGGSNFVTPGGRQFRADQYFGGIDRTSSVLTGDIANTTIDAIYRTGRSSPSFSYNIPVPNGRVNVILHFAEVWYGAPGKGTGGAGKRQFHVNIEGSRKLTNFDIFATAGGAMRAVQKVFPVSVTDGKLNIDFLTGAADMPRVSAIEVITSSITLKPLADASVDGQINGGGGGFENYGADTKLEVKYLPGGAWGSFRSYLKFPIGAAGNIATAKLRIYGSNRDNTSDITMEAYGADNDSWIEDRIMGSGDETPYLSSPITPNLSTSVLGTVQVNNVMKYYEVDVTSYLKSQQQAGESLVTLVLHDSKSQNVRLVFNSKENATNPPLLFITPAPEVNATARTGQEEISEPLEPQPQQSFIYPNPVGKQFTLSISSVHRASITVDLINQAGRSYEVRLPENIKAGQNAEVNISNLSLGAGIYMLKIHSETATEVLTVLIKE